MTRPTDEEMTRRIREKVYTWASLGQTACISRLLAEVRGHGFTYCKGCRMWRQGGCVCQHEKAM